VLKQFAEMQRLVKQLSGGRLPNLPGLRGLMGR
jgi:hypothetical protein